MADIDIEKKKSVWPWIIAGAIIVAILLIIFIDNSPEAAIAEDEPVETAVGAGAIGTGAEVYGDADTPGFEAGSVDLINEDFKAAPVIDYVTFVNENEDRFGMAHNYTHDALIKLIDAIEALANELNHNLEANFSKVHNLANDITSGPESDQHADKIIKALRITTNALTGLQRSYYPTLSEEIADMEGTTTQLEGIVNDLNPDELTLDQKKLINSYFNQSAQVLKLMN